MSLSICMIVKNEENCLERCLYSVKEIADEIIIVDTGSTDRTPDIAGKFTEKIFMIEWPDDFSKARNFALSKAKGDWILVLDADEMLDKDSLRKIKEAVKDSSADAFILTQCNYTSDLDAFRFTYADDPLGKKFPGYVPIPAIRLFRNRKKIIYNRKVHETVDKSIKDGGLDMKSLEDVRIHHFSEEKGNKREKQMRYFEMAREEINEDPENAIAHYNISTGYENYLHDYENSLKHILLAYRYGLRPDIALIGIGGTLMNLKRYDEALDAFKEALAKGNRDPIILYFMGMIFYHKKEFAKARELFNLFVTYNHPRKQEIMAILDKMKSEP